MIEGLKPYAEYKESGVPWIGRVPSDWRVERTKWIFRSRKELNVGRRNTNVLSLTLRGVVNNDPDSPEGMVPKDYATYQLFRKHDLVFKLIDLENIRTSRVGLVHEDGIMSSAYVRLAPSKSVNIRFFYFQFFDLYTRAVFNALGAGVRSTLGATDLGELRIAVPPHNEQAAIVRFLDHANRKIDGFIRAKRKLIGLLNEQKQAIIHRAVTGKDEVRMVKDENGNSSFILQPSTLPKKPSGIPWLGDIPKHWEVRRLRFCIVGKLSYGANAAAEFDNPDWPRYLRITDFNNDGSLRADTFRSLPPHVAKDYPVEDGDILFARSGATVGKAFLVRTEIEKACYAGYLIRARPNADVVLPTFLFAFTQSTAFACWKDAIFNRATIQNIGADKYANLIVPIPPIAEQQAILDFIEKDIAPLRTAIARTEREIALMQEYRTRLTADLVTGKLDVREAAAKLPDLPNETVATTDEAFEEIEPEEVEA